MSYMLCANQLPTLLTALLNELTIGGISDPNLKGITLRADVDGDTHQQRYIIRVFDDKLRQFLPHSNGLFNCRGNNFEVSSTGVVRVVPRRGYSLVEQVQARIDR
jgi:hypothetical protein